MANTVNTRHADYDANLEFWTRCGDAIDGEDAIKDGGETYLPKPSGQETAEYNAYKARAVWFNASGRTIEGLEGEVFRNDPVIETPDGMDDILKDYTLTGMSVQQFSRTVLRERIRTGRYGEWVDWSEQQNRPFSIGYKAEDIINWRISSTPGNRRLELVVLKETVDIPGSSIFETDQETLYRVLYLDPNGVYTVEEFQTSSEAGTINLVSEPMQPRIFGRTMDFIPFIFYGVSENNVDVEMPPLLDIVNLNIADYRNSADLEHGRHFCGSPWFYLFGATEYTEKGSLHIGSAEAVVSADPDAKAGVVEFSGQGLGALEKAREEKRSEMATMGARILEESKRVGETAEAIARRQSGKLSVLQSMAEVQDQGHEKALMYHAMWMGIQNPDVSFSLNKDYVVSKMEPQEITALVQAWQGGAISRSTLFWNMQQGERVPPDTTLDEEIAAIEAETDEFSVEPIAEAAGG